MRTFLLAAALTAAIFSTAQAQPTGAQVFQDNCAICHKLAPGQNSTGPSLYGVYGRKAGTSNFNYSAAMKKRAADGMVWNDENLTKWVTKPTAFIPGTTMGFIGLEYPEDAKPLIAFLKNGGTDAPSGGGE